MYASVSVGHMFAGSSLGEAVHRQAFSEVPVWTPGCYARFSWLHSVLLIAADLWKLGNRDCTTERLLTSPTFPHSHFQRFHRFWSTDWWWRTAGAGGQQSQNSVPRSLFPGLTESVMGLQPLLFIAERVREVLDRVVQFCMHANSQQHVPLLKTLVIL